MSELEIKCVCGKILLSINKPNIKEYKLFGWTFYKNKTASSFSICGDFNIECSCGKKVRFYNGYLAPVLKSFDTPPSGGSSVNPPPKPMPPCNKIIKDF